MTRSLNSSSRLLFWSTLLLGLPYLAFAAPGNNSAIEARLEPSRTISEELDFQLHGNVKRGVTTQMADGTYMQSGSISSTFRWQSSGELTSNSCPSMGGTMTIRNCYQMFLSRRGMLQSTTDPSKTTSAARLRRRASLEDMAAADDTRLDLYFRVFPEQAKFRWSAPLSVNGVLERRQAPACPTTPTTSGGPTGPTQAPSPRQRIEMFTWPGAAPGEVWYYTWKTYQAASTTTGNNFFHGWQILRRDGCGGPVITLDYVRNQAVINDVVRGCKGCDSIALSSWVGRTIQHTMTIKYGLAGSIDYSAVDVQNRKVKLLEYKIAKGDMGASASLKWGQYRAAFDGMRDATAWVGEYQGKRLS